MRVFQTIGYFLSCIVGLTLITILAFMIWGLPGSPGYNYIHGTTTLPHVGLILATCLSIISTAMVGALI